MERIQSFSFRCGRKTPENCSRENPRNQVGTENSSGVVEEEGKERVLKNMCVQVLICSNTLLYSKSYKSKFVKSLPLDESLCPNLVSLSPLPLEKKQPSHTKPPFLKYLLVISKEACGDHVASELARLLVDNSTGA